MAALTPTVLDAACVESEWVPNCSRLAKTYVESGLGFGTSGGIAFEKWSDRSGECLRQPCVTHLVVRGERADEASAPWWLAVRIP